MFTVLLPLFHVGKLMLVITGCPVSLRAVAIVKSKMDDTVKVKWSGVGQ